jgi:hypothetical protein
MFAAIGNFVAHSSIKTYLLDLKLSENQGTTAWHFMSAEAWVLLFAVKC